MKTLIIFEILAFVSLIGLCIIAIVYKKDYDEATAWGMAAAWCALVVTKNIKEYLEEKYNL